PAEAQEVEEHLLVVAAQQDRGWQPLAQLEEELDRVPRRRAAVDVVTEEDELIVRTGIDVGDQALELGRAPVHVAHAQQTPGHVLLSSASNRLRRSGSPSTSSAAVYGSTSPLRSRSLTPSRSPLASARSRRSASSSRRISVHSVTRSRAPLSAVSPARRTSACAFTFATSSSMPRFAVASVSSTGTFQSDAGRRWSIISSSFLSRRAPSRSALLTTKMSA